MSTVKELDTEVSAKVIAQTGSTFRLTADWRDESGEYIKVAVNRTHRIRIDTIEHSVLDSNTKAYLCQVLVDMIVRMSVNLDESDYMVQNWTDQQTLLDHAFWTDMAAVMQIQPDTTVQVVDSTELDGDVLRYTVGANVILQP